MKKLYLLIISFCLFVNGVYAVDVYDTGVITIDVNDSTKRLQQKPSTRVKDTRPDRPGKNDIRLNIVPFKPVNTRVFSSPSASQNNTNTAGSQKGGPDSRTLSNVKVLTNVRDGQISLSYSLNKDTNVTIKIMDVLGNEVATLLSQRVASGEQNNSFSVTSKLSSGYYFIRLIAGGETVIKRISIM